MDRGAFGRYRAVKRGRMAPPCGVGQAPQELIHVPPTVGLSRIPCSSWSVSYLVSPRPTPTSRRSARSGQRIAARRCAAAAGGRELRRVLGSCSPARRVRVVVPIWQFDPLSCAHRCPEAGRQTGFGDHRSVAGPAPTRVPWLKSSRSRQHFANRGSDYFSTLLV